MRNQTVITRSVRDFQELQSLVNDGSLRVIQMVGVPRSMSTAFGRALNESEIPSVYVNEPFNRENNDLDQAAASLLEIYDAQLGSTSIPGVIITKNMASYMQSSAFNAIDSLASSTIWNIRHPYLQMGSLLTQLVNDLNMGSGEDHITQDDIYPYLEQATDYLLDSPKSHDFSKTGWAALRAHVAAAHSESLAVDGQVFVTDPAVCLKKVCRYIALPYQIAMYTAWKRPFNNVINRDRADETKRSAWTREVSVATGVVASERKALDLERVPDILRAHILNVALPTYTELVNQTISTDDNN